MTHVKMDLFVVNRYEEEKEVEENEAEKLAKVLKRIEIRKRPKETTQEKRKFKKKRLHENETTGETELPNVEEISVQENTEKESLANVNLNNEEGGAAQEQVKISPGEVEGFTVLGGQQFERLTEVKRVLPNWLQHPTVISVDLQKLDCKVSQLKVLDESLRKKLKQNGISKFFPVQAEVIPWLLKSYRDADIIFPRDVCISAPTGSGKTLAFVLPIIQALQRYTMKMIRALVILPTQNLAYQVFKTFKEYSKDTSIAVCLITGKSSFEQEQKQLVTENVAFGYMSKIDILVCTAGRLVDHIKLTKGFSLHNLEFLVIDEADRVLDNVQNDWLYHLQQHIEEGGGTFAVKVLNLYALRKKRPPQKLLFSATLSQDPEKLQKLSLFQPKLFTSVVETDQTKTDTKENSGTFVGKYTTPKELTEKYIVTSMELKPLVLYKFVKTEKLTKTLVFVHSVEAAHRLALLLRLLFKNKLTVEEISSNLVITKRQSLIDKFSSGNIDLLVCTDSLARGMDFSGVQCVISYSAPKHLKAYIHRAGRTARAGENGLAVTILHTSQLTLFKKLFHQASKNIAEIMISEDDLKRSIKRYEKALQNLKQVVTAEQKANLVKLKRSKRPSKINGGKTKRKRRDSVASTSRT